MCRNAIACAHAKLNLKKEVSHIIILSCNKFSMTIYMCMCRVWIQAAVEDAVISIYLYEESLTSRFGEF